MDLICNRRSGPKGPASLMGWFGGQVIQVISVLGALAILVAYAANQLRWIGPSNRSYTLLNFLGAGTLSVVAVLEQQWGFLLLEAAWTLISACSLVQLVRSREVGSG